VRSALRPWLERIGLLHAARAAQHRLFPDREAMRFPPYGPKLARDIRVSGDPVRYSSLALALGTVKSEGIPGDLAEVGVYRGDTSRFLVRCMPDRRLHLFDTFKGFPQHDREPENWSDERFQNTSETAVRAVLGPSANIVIHAGTFPGTAAGLEQERFAFVLLDLDVYAPTRSGLEFFYPRLSPGGYCFVHDFNSPESNWACRRALTEFMAGKPERVIELPDTWGSAVFRKGG
jgi:O-methyltransferase